ncbi:MAG: hypothetical protein ACJ0QL_02705 [Parvicellaceae bacterium]
MRKLFYILLLFSSCGFSQQQEFTAKSNQLDLLIGEPAELKFELSFSSSISIDEISFPQFKLKDTLGNNWELWAIDSLKTSNYEAENGEFITKISQNIQIANFDTGRYEFPPIYALVNDEKIFTESLNFTVKSIKISEDESIKKIKELKIDPLSFFERIIIWLKKYGIYLVLIIILVIILLLLVNKLKPKKKENSITAPSIPVPVILLEKLHQIEEKKLWQNGKHKQYFTEITDVTKEFIEYRYQVPTFEKTSIEIINALNLTLIDQQWIVKLEKLFTISDLVKFAKLLPTNQENSYAIETTKAFIENERDDLPLNNSEDKE